MASSSNSDPSVKPEAVEKRTPVSLASPASSVSAARAVSSVQEFINATATNLVATERPKFDLTLGKDFGVSVEDLKETMDLNKRLSTQAVRTLRLARREAIEASAKGHLLGCLAKEDSPAQLGVFLGSVLGNAGVRSYLRGPLYSLLREDYVVDPVKGLGSWGVHETLVGSVHEDVDASLGGLISSLLRDKSNRVFLRAQLDWSLREPLVAPTAWAIGHALADNLKPITASALSAVAEHQLRDQANITYVKEYAKEVLLDTIRRHTRPEPAAPEVSEAAKFGLE